jgi:hypothetical protein
VKARALAVILACEGCTTMLAPPDDLADYRAYRVAAPEGTRLRRAKDYLERHPNGRFAGEVRAAFDEEEPHYFARAQESRRGVRNYLADLPDGPHAEAALALLVAFGRDMREAELADIARRAQRDEAMLEAAATQRREASAAVLDTLALLLDDDVYGAPLSQAPPKLQRVLSAPGASTWGAGVRGRVERAFVFDLPTRPARTSRVLKLAVTMIETDGVATGAKLEGPDLLVRWAEADRIVAVDTSADDRNEAHVHVMTRLGGALERRFPSATCKDVSRGRELYHRACEGWEVVVVPAERPDGQDVLLLSAPRGRR